MKTTLSAAAGLLALLLPAVAFTAEPTSPSPSPSGAAGAAGSTVSSLAAKPAKLRPRNAVDRTSSDPAAATFNSFDTNNDGYVSREEARESAELTRRFDQLDRNRDGRLSPGEVSGWRNVSYRRTVSENPGAARIAGETPGNIPPTIDSKR